MDQIRFDGRVAVITGAGGGLGRAHALLLAQRGAAVVVNDLGGSVNGAGGDDAAARRVVAEIEAAGGRALANFDDIATPEGAQRLVDAAVQGFGRLDVLINNAGILRDKTLHKMAPEDFEAVVRVHLLGSAWCSRAALPVMQAQQYGRIVMTTSAAILCSVLSRRMPALLMSTSRRPKPRTAAFTRRCAPSGVAMSSKLAMARPPAASISATTRRAAASSPPAPFTLPPRSFTTTAAPRLASSKAWARPRPPPAPVITATRPSNRI